MATEVGAAPVAEMDARDDGGSNEPNGDAVDAMAVDIAKEAVAMEAAEDEGETGEKEKEADGAKEDGEEKGDVNEGEGEGEDEEGSDGDAAQQAAARRQPLSPASIAAHHEELRRLQEEQKRFVLADLAVATSQYNQQLLEERRQRPFFYDLHTRFRHVPYARSVVLLDKPIGSHPVAILPDHYQDHRPNVLAAITELRKSGALIVPTAPAPLPVAVAPSPAPVRLTPAPVYSSSLRAILNPLQNGSPPSVAAAVATVVAAGMVPAPMPPGSVAVKPMSGKARRLMAAGMCAVVMTSGRLCKNPGDLNGRCFKHKDWAAPSPATTMSDAAHQGPLIGNRCETRLNNGTACGQVVPRMGDRCFRHKLPGRWGSFLCGEPLETMAYCSQRVDREGARCALHTLGKAARPAATGTGSASGTPSSASATPARSRRTCHVCSKPDGPDTPLLQCITCERYGHAACWELEPEIFAKALTYPWQCIDDKMCMVCRDPGNEELLMICDGCDRGCHTFCAVPKLAELPNGSWHCAFCSPTA